MAELKLLLLVACCLLRGACSCRVTGAQQAPAVLAVWIVRLFQGVFFWGVVTAACLGRLGGMGRCQLCRPRRHQLGRADSGEPRQVVDQ